MRVLHVGDADVLITKQIRGEGDTLVILGEAGDDRLDASALAGDGTPTVFPDLIAVQLKGDDAANLISGADTLIGSPWNDVLDGGLGNDRITGGPGLDIFFDAGGSDTLVETQDLDMGAVPGHVHHWRDPVERRLHARSRVNGYTDERQLASAVCERRRPELPHLRRRRPLGRRRDGREPQGPLRERRS